KTLGSIDVPFFSWQSVAMVGNQDKQGVIVPIFGFGRFQKFMDGLIGIICVLLNLFYLIVFPKLLSMIYFKSFLITKDKNTGKETLLYNIQIFYHSFKYIMVINSPRSSRQ